ncbi:NAD(P)H-dependent oxidoreductase [Tessaracoccus sp. OS52]|uniref:NADPH-dependent FMN reductase n=1 Tax=Tessaracoccus sp. OS52 TaxID=2886691 RepID=UPI001D1072BE|nr:NAD(P)H-dependent oxidoreductase [Tessaracoccus sp. OS52]MCC2592410.1 NAD(P)H-dependent oxidoreductase [Tessaracoccus sp. OS52]
MTAVGVIIASTRPSRIGDKVGAWVAEEIRRRTGARADLIDLAEVALPFMDEPEPSSGVYLHPHTRAWARRVEKLGALVLVTAEYNGSFPASLKNALDFLGPEWSDLPVAVVAYGNSSSGARAATALLPVLVGLAMIPVGSFLLGLRTRRTDTGIEFSQRDADGLAALTRRLLRVAAALEEEPSLTGRAI